VERQERVERQGGRASCILQAVPRPPKSVELELNACLAISQLQLRGAIMADGWRLDFLGPLSVSLLLSLPRVTTKPQT
jgi:hypothetical protein